LIVLGINAYHGDAAACVVRDGRIVAAAEEERFRRVKHWAGFPSEAIRYCLDEAGAQLQDVDHVAVNSDPSANLLRKLGYTLYRRPSPSYVLERLRNRRELASIPVALEDALPGERFDGHVHQIEHHLAHLASCFFASSFDDAVALSVDGFGDFASTAWGLGQGSSLSGEDRVYFPHSLGIFYQALTQYLGFPHYGDEYKVMGLAPYGRPTYVDVLRRLVRLTPRGRFELDLEHFRHHREGFQYRWSDGAPVVGNLFSDRLAELLGPPRRPDEPVEARHRDLANSVQVVYEDAFFHILEYLHRQYGVDRLALAGGCAMNSVANGKILRCSAFTEVYTQAAAGDAGGAIGAALVVLVRETGQRPKPMMDAYLGPAFSQQAIDSLLDARQAALRDAGCSVRRILDEAELCRTTAAAIADGQVVGWFQGRMEWGPRALGNRSILCDPRRADMKAILNDKIKRRESFRPFAPSILREAVADWFEEEADVPFMTAVFQIREDRRPQIPAVTHVDGSGRLQTVHRETNGLYYALIEAFRDLTGVPVVLNTSFNENEPVVCRPEQALDCFLRTRMDLLVLGNCVVERRSRQGP
jgi:carbamoyltransferase